MKGDPFTNITTLKLMALFQSYASRHRGPVACVVLLASLLSALVVSMSVGTAIPPLLKALGELGENASQSLCEDLIHQSITTSLGAPN